MKKGRGFIISTEILFLMSSLPALAETSVTVEEGTVKVEPFNTNQTVSTTVVWQTTPPRALRRRFGWEFNGMRLHEYYFGSMGKDTTPISRTSSLSREITQAFGSFETWQKEFMATGAMRGIGWVILAHDSMGARLFNIWVNEHDEGLLAGAEPLLVMDVFEHAFITDYGLEKDKYIAAFWKAIQWAEVQHRFEASTSYESLLAGTSCSRFAPEE